MSFESRILENKRGWKEEINRKAKSGCFCTPVSGAAHLLSVFHWSATDNWVKCSVQVIFQVSQIKMSKSKLRLSNTRDSLNLDQKFPFSLTSGRRVNSELNPHKLAGKLQDLKSWVEAISGPSPRSSASQTVRIYFYLHLTFVFQRVYTVAPTQLAWRQTTVFTQTQSK